MDRRVIDYSLEILADTSGFFDELKPNAANAIAKLGTEEDKKFAEKCYTITAPPDDSKSLKKNNPSTVNQHGLSSLVNEYVQA